MKNDVNKTALRVLVVDVGGTHVKCEHSGSDERREFESGQSLSAEAMVAELQRRTADWEYDVVTIGVPAPVVHGKLLHDPHNLGRGWAGFDFAAAFGKPTILINDAAMQALGDYQGGKMLFLGLGTGLGSAMIVDGIVEPMELAHLPYKKGRTFEDYVGMRGLKRLGKKKWRTAVADVVNRLRDALDTEYVVIGGGNARLLKDLPEKTTAASNDNAFAGGYRYWDGGSAVDRDRKD